MELVDLQLEFNKIKGSAEKIIFSDVELNSNFKNEYEKYILENKPNGYAKVEWSKFSTKITTTTGKLIYITNYWFYIAAELAGYLGGLESHKEMFQKIFEESERSEVAAALRKGVESEKHSKIKGYLTENGFSQEEIGNFIKFVSDYHSWGGGKTIDRNDYYVSPLLKAGNLLAETQGAVAEIAKQFAQKEIIRKNFNPTFISNNSFPKIVLEESEKKISARSCGEFIFGLIEYLLENSIEGSLFESVIKKNDKHGSHNIEFQGEKLTSIFKVSESELVENDLIRGEKARFFSKPFVIGSEFYYLSNQWTDGTDSRLDIVTFISIFESKYPDYKIVRENSGYALLKIDICKSIGVSKPFLLLAGISGTGKTRYVREQAKATGSLTETYCLASVRPDWHEPSDLLGYVSRLNSQAEYVTTDVLQFIASAWRAIVDADIAMSTDYVEGHGERLLVTGDKAKLDRVEPYWLCLDEMNLAPVEQYFADYLSVLETREWAWEDSSFTYLCDPLLKATTIKQVADVGKIRSDLGFSDEKYNDVWALICQHGLSIPFNLMVAGTVNMDETTHGFSRKVIDRALSFDFGEFFPNDFEQFFEPSTRHLTLSYPIGSQAQLEDCPRIDDKNTGLATVDFLKVVNGVLENTPFELAYRALNELLLAVVCQNPSSRTELKAVWDDFLMCKVLPRIEGDSDKLVKRDSSRSLLEDLQGKLAAAYPEVWGEPDEADPSIGFRPDLHREKLGAEGDDKVISIACRSRAKMDWMQSRLDSSGFTSFWP